MFYIVPKYSVLYIIIYVKDNKRTLRENEMTLYLALRMVYREKQFQVD